MTNQIRESMDLLSQRKNDELAIFRAFAEWTLAEHGKKMQETQSKAMAGFKSSFWKQLNVQTTDVSLDLHLRPEHRWVDMRSRYVKSTKEKMLKAHHEVYNSVVMTHYNGILMDMTYGLTEAIKNELKKNFNK